MVTVSVMKLKADTIWGGVCTDSVFKFCLKTHLLNHSHVGPILYLVACVIPSCNITSRHIATILVLSFISACIIFIFFVAELLLLFFSLFFFGFVLFYSLHVVVSTAHNGDRIRLLYQPLSPYPRQQHCGSGFSSERTKHSLHQDSS